MNLIDLLQEEFPKGIQLAPGQATLAVTRGDSRVFVSTTSPISGTQRQPFALREAAQALLEGQCRPDPEPVNSIDTMASLGHLLGSLGVVPYDQVIVVHVDLNRDGVIFETPWLRMPPPLPVLH